MTHSHSDPRPFSVDCDRFDAQLAAFLERDLDASQREWMQQHLVGCTRCHALLADIESLTRQATVLPSMTPSRDLWSGIAARLDTAIVPLHGAVAPAQPFVAAGEIRADVTPIGRRFSVRTFAIAATLLMSVTSAVTWRLARVSPPANAPVAAINDSADRATIVPVVSADVTYEQEIAALREVVNERFTELDSATVAVLQHNLAIIDQAIADSRAALEKDPGSRILSTTLDRALETKLSLMRRVALL